MNVLAWILGTALIAVFGFAGITKVLDLDRMREHFGYSQRQYQAIGLFEIVCASGVLAGLLSSKWVGGAAAVSLGGLMIGALIAHARVEDEGKKAMPALVMLAVASVFVIAISLR